MSHRVASRTALALILLCLASPALAARRIELIGDSISAGYGNTGKNPRCHISARNQDPSQSYGAIAARSVHAELLTVAYPGKGVYRNNDGSLSETMRDIYERTLSSEPWRHRRASGWRADAVVINLGTNDFEQSPPPRQGFTGAYLALARRVRQLYPSAYLVFALGPMLSDQYPVGQRALSTARFYIHDVIAQLRASGDERVRFLEFPMQDGSDGFGCDFHPNVATHRRMATLLTRTLRTTLGW